MHSFLYSSARTLLLLTTLLIFGRCASPPAVQQFTGQTMGTTYKVTIPNGKLDLSAQASIDSLLLAINESMSTYMEHALISRINNSADTTERFALDQHFITVFQKAKEIYQHTERAFNPALGPLIKAWGFDAELPHTLSKAEVVSLLDRTDFNAFVLDEKSNHLTKTRPDVALNFSAIAKGYGVDAIAAWLASRGISNYYVEIGGEVRTNGQNPVGRLWRIGIDRPVVNDNQARSLQAIIPLGQNAMATSGNYRNFYIRDGKKYVHTINPATGYPEDGTLLSATVLASDCMTADAYATAFMVMGLERAKQFVLNAPELEAYFISSGEQSDFLEYFSPGFPEKMDMEPME